MNTEKAKGQLQSLYRRMAELTRPACVERTCHQRAPLSEFHCCDEFYCLSALEYATSVWKQEVKPVNEKGLLFMGPNGCVLEPHLRPSCTLHNCSINAFGTTGNSRFDSTYFQIRRKIELIELLLFVGEK